jgi:beta-glucanase (GH16 family)
LVIEKTQQDSMHNSCSFLEFVENVLEKENNMKKIYFIVILLLSLSLFACQNGNTDEKFERVPMVPEELIDSPVPYLENGYQLVWADEFNYTGLPDSTKWGYDLGVGNWGWGNNELQTYTNRAENVYVDNDVMTITALKERYDNSDYTSARVVSRHKGDWLYGRVEVKAKLSEGKGTWPAIWMMPTDSIYGVWPRSGEIDIMEAVGYKPNRVLGTVHTENNYGGNGIGREIPFENTSTEFHVYSLEWTPDQIKIFADEILISTYNNPKFAKDNQKFWPFDQRFHLIMNIAMGGTLGRDVDPNFTSATMEIDYVRVYQRDYTEQDKTAPSVVELTEWHTTQNAINISWSKASDNVGVSHYEIVLNGKQIGATNKNSYQIKNLDSDTTYKVRIISVDLAGNYSITSSIQIKTTGANIVPGRVEAENANEINEGSIASLSEGYGVTLKNSSGINGSLILELTVNEAGSYQITLYGTVLRPGNQLSVYLVDDSGDGEKTNTFNLTPTWGLYEEIEVPFTFNFSEGKCFIKLETASENSGDVITIDYLEVIKNG